MSSLILALLFLILSKNVNPGEATGCLNFIGDVHFLLNTTQNFDIESINGEKDFVARFAESFQIGQNNVQIGVTLFSSQIHHQFDMGLHSNLTSMLEAIEYIPNRLGSSQTDNALEWVFKHAFSKDAGNRETVPNILIVLTDVYAVKEIQRLASGLQGHDISVFVIGIGLLPDPSKLAQIVTHQQGISPVSASGTLWDLQIKLQDSVCQVVPTTTETVPANCIDATYVKCDDIHVCSDNALRQKCPVTCGLCVVPTTSKTIPASCIDATYVKCDDNHVCSDNVLRQKCPVTCGLCDEGVKSTTISWLHIVGK